MRWFLLAVLAAPLSAQAQECWASAGATAAATHGHRDWDLSTPGLAQSASPSVSVGCEGGGTFITADAAPAVRHSYGSLGSRGALGLTTRIGAEVALGWRSPLWLQAHITTNGVAWGTGLALRSDDMPLSLRMDLYPGRDPTLAASLHVDVARWDMYRTKDGRDIGWGDNPLVVRHGFEVGQFTGYRLEVGPRDEGPQFGARAGTIGNLRAKSVAQPVAVGFIDLPVTPGGVLSIELAGGASLREGVVDPALGARMLVDIVDSPFQMHVGTLFGVGDRPWRSSDMGIGFMW